MRCKAQFASVISEAERIRSHPQKQAQQYRFNVTIRKNRWLPRECRCLALVSHHRHHCLFSSFYFSHSELSFCGSHRYKGVSPTRVRPHLSIKPTQAPPSLAVQRHLRRHSFGSLAHAERGGEALLPDSAARRHCYVARYLQRLGRRRESAAAPG